MEENKAELTDEEKKRRNLINYFLGKPKKIKLDDIYDTNKKEYQQGEKCKNPEKDSWWYDGEIFNQQAHVIMNILSYEIPNRIPFIPNIGYRLWFILASNDTKDGIIDNEVLKNKIIDKLKDDNKRKEFLEKNESNINFNNPDVIELTIEKKLNLYDIVNNNFEHTSKENKLDILLDYVELYFSSPSNFSSSSDYSKYNESILNNLYNWYLKDLNKDNDRAEIKKYCKKILKIISNLQEKLIEYFDNTVHKYNLICTLCKTNEILNKLKLKLLEDDDQTKDYLGTENDLINTILDHIELTPSIKFNNHHKK